MAETETPLVVADESPTPQTHPPPPLSLFPVSTTAAAATTTTTTASSAAWLRNSSFTVDISAVTDAVPSLNTTVNHHDDDDDDEQDSNAKPKPYPASYEILESSSGEEEGRDRKESSKKKKKMKMKRRKREKAYDFDARKYSIHKHHHSSKDYYFDSRGDPDNLAFGSLYRMDIVRYKLHDAANSSDMDLQVYSRLSNRGSLLRGELDVDRLDDKIKSNGRYWSAKYSALERHRNFKRVRLVAPKNAHVVFDDFVPLLDEEGGENLSSGTSVVEESWDDEVLRKTREFNKMTREQPHNVKVWIGFAEFQDKVASKQPQKGARLQTLEKKLSILEKATELNPEDEDLLLYLLKAYQVRDSADVVLARWEKILMQNPGSCKLWKAFLRVIQGEFSTFKVSELRKMFAHAIQALSAASSKRHRQVHPTVELPSPDAVDIEFELGIVDIFLSLCRFEWQAGYHELATALFQAEMEYALFCPPLQVAELSKKRLFEYFWNSDSARVGEDGALGWSTWLEKEEENRQKILREMSSKEDKQGGWTGWFVPSSKDKEDLANFEDIVITDEPLVEMEEEKEDENVKPEEDDNALLRMLGIDVHAEADKDVHDTRTWVRWSQEESSRDCDQWMPLHGKSGVTHSVEETEEREEQLSRVILFDDVSDYLFSLRSNKARLALVMMFIDFFGGQTSPCICTNSSSWTEKMLSLEMLPDYIQQYLIRAHGGCNQLESRSISPSLELLLQRPDSAARTEKMKFLRNATLLCLRIFPRNYKIEEAILIAEDQSAGEIKGLQFTAMPSQAIAKRLLKSDRQDILLCGVYAQREAAFGNIGHARKVFDMALSSINALPPETQFLCAPMLTLWYSEMELAEGSSNKSESISRAVHILSCLGCGMSYSPYKGAPSGTQLLKAHQGFKDRLNTLRSSQARHVTDDSYISLVCSAALFEELTAGWVAGVEVLTDALSMILPERKSRSYRFEVLCNYHIKMLQRHHEEARLSKLLQALSAGLHIYPCNPELFSSLVQLSHLYSVPSSLRRIFDELCHKKPSVLLWLFALSYEFRKGGSPHRIHGLFERALANDELRSSVVLWRCYIAYEIEIRNLSSARRIFFRAIHACPWSKLLWLDGFQKLHNTLSAKELMDLLEVMRDKELNLRTDIYEILLMDEDSHG